MRRTHDTARLETSHAGTYWNACFKDAEGKRRRRIIGRVDQMSRREARSEMVGLIKEIGRNPAHAEKYASVSLSEWCRDYLDSRADLEPGSIALLERTAALMAEHWPADPKVDAIPPSQVDRFRDALLVRVSRRGGALSAQTVLLHLRNCRAIFAAAVRAGKAGINPFEGVKVRSTKRMDEWRFVTLPEFDALLAVLPDRHWRCLFALCRWAGCRLGLRGGEALGLAWADVCWDSRTLIVDDAKRHATRTVPMRPGLYALLREALEAAEVGQEHVCPVRTTDLDHKARAYYRAAGLGEISKPFHSLRKACEQEWLCEHPLPLVCAWLGNSPKVALKHYFQGHERGALERVTGGAGIVAATQGATA